MPNINGMTAAEHIRDIDEDVVIMFITNMAQYAIEGYSVDALDFVMKPINYYTFSMKLKRVIKRIQKKNKEQHRIILWLPDGLKRLYIRQIYYIEVQNRVLYSCVADGSLLDFIENIDLYAILGNAIDNAIEAVEKIDDIDKRQIDVIIHRQKNFMCSILSILFLKNLHIRENFR